MVKTTVEASKVVACSYW